MQGAELMAPASLCRFVPVQTGSRVAAEVWSSGIQLCYRTHDFTHLIKRFSISDSDVLRVGKHHRPTFKGLRSVSDESLHNCSVTSFNKPIRSENINAQRRTYLAEMTLKSQRAFSDIPASSAKAALNTLLAFSITDILIEK